MRVLVTGGAGFIGSHLVDLLVARGDEVTVLDNLDPQVHPHSRPPAYLNPRARYVFGDVRDAAALEPLLAGCEGLVHLAAAVGVGQSQYQIHHYTDVNVGGTARLLDLLAARRDRPGKLVVASSMSAYGEGAYRCPRCGPVAAELRREEDLAAGDWEQHCPACRAPLEARPTPESEPFKCNSVYALTKKVQEEQVLLFGRVYRLPAAALRFFNVYGPRQSLANPYTGVAAIFLSRLKAGQQPVVFEDGNQTRDFIYVADIARAIALALDHPAAGGRAFNVGAGRPQTIRGVAEELARLLGVALAPRITGQFRSGDIRHCAADLTLIGRQLGFAPAYDFARGMRELIAWSRDAEYRDRFEEAHRELLDRGLA